MSSGHNRETTGREKRRAEGEQRHYDEKEPALIHGICSRCAIEKLELNEMQKSNYEDNWSVAFRIFWTKFRLADKQKTVLN